MSSPYIVVLVTAKNRAEARKIAQVLLKAKLAACANIIPAVESLFWWEGKIDKAAEIMLILKSKKSLFAKLAAAVKSAHSYQNPEIIALGITAGSKDYLAWLNTSVR